MRNVDSKIRKIEAKKQQNIYNIKEKRAATLCKNIKPVYNVHKA